MNCRRLMRPLPIYADARVSNVARQHQSDCCAKAHDDRCGSWTGFREVNDSIVASQGRLLLTKYESLTMAAHFADATLPEAHERDQIPSVPPGAYDCRIIQLSDAASDAPFG